MTFPWVSKEKYEKLESEFESQKFLSSVHKDCIEALVLALKAKKHKWTGYERSLVNQSLRMQDEWM